MDWKSWRGIRVYKNHNYKTTSFKKSAMYASANGCYLLQSGRPVAFASTARTASETKYAKTEKELLVITFAFKKFH